MADKLNDLTVLQYLANVAAKEATDLFEKFYKSRPEFSDTNKSVSPRIFQKIFDDHLAQTYNNHLHLAQARDAAWMKYTELTDENAKLELKEKADVAVKGMNSFDDLFRRIVKVIQESATRVNWKKHNKGNFQAKLEEWLEMKHGYFRTAGYDSANSGVRSELKAIQEALDLGMKVLTDKANERSRRRKSSMRINTGRTSASASSKTTPMTATPKTAIPKTATPKTATPTFKNAKSGTKRPQNDQGVGSPQKKPRQPGQEATGWWGPENSKLDCSDAFFDIIAESKAYVEHPTHPLGTEEYRNQLEGFLKRALEAVDKGSFFDDIMLHREWNFRDPSLRNVNVPIFIRPGLAEDQVRLGDQGHRGSNDFKEILGGGLTAAEKYKGDKDDKHSGMLSLAQSDSTAPRVSLRGGAGGYGEDSVAQQQRSAREATNLHFRDPDTLWNQLLQDSTFPGEVFRHHVEDGRPPMLDMKSAGGNIAAFKETVRASFDAKEWAQVQNAKGARAIKELIAQCCTFAREARQRAYNFVHMNPDHIFPEMPKLTEEGGKDTAALRYDRLRSRDFAKPFGYAFRARAFQVFVLALHWKLYLEGQCSLIELLDQERENLEIWDVHEELYMEWENLRWFRLKSDVNIKELETRYFSREYLRARWAKEREEITKAIKKLRQNPNDFGNASDYLSPGVHPLPKRSGRPRLSTYQPITPEVSPDKEKLMDLDDPGVDGPGETPGGTGDDEANAAHDEMDIDGATNATGGVGAQKGDIDSETRRAGVDIALEILTRTRDVYSEKLAELVKHNDELDDEDPGNHALIHRNNVDVMAKNQVIWNFNAEILNLQRSIDPLSEETYGRGVDQKWELPEDRTIRANTRTIPARKELPLGITTLGIGPMPGCHPLPDHPRVLVGCTPDLGEYFDDDGHTNPAGNSLFGGPPMPAADAGAGRQQQEDVDNNMGTSDNKGMNRNTSNSAARALLGTPARTLNQFKDILKAKNKAKLTIRRLTRMQSGGKPLNQREMANLNAAQRSKKQHSALYKKRWREANPLTRAEVDLIEQSEDDTLGREIKEMEEDVDARLAQYLQYFEEDKEDKERLANAEKAKKEADIRRANNPGEKLVTWGEIRTATDKIPQVPLPAKPQPATQPQPQPHPQPQARMKPPPTPHLLEKARTRLEEAKKEYTRCAERTEKAIREADLAEKATTEYGWDPEVKRISDLAQTQRLAVFKEFSDATTVFQVRSEAFQAQSRWDDPAETFDELQKQLVNLSEDLDVWAGGRGLDSTAKSIEERNDQWILEVISLMFESYKAMGVNTGPEYWDDMYSNFWRVPAGNLQRKRKAWLHALVLRLNQQIERQEFGPIQTFLKTPSAPLAEWPGEPLTKEQLLFEAEMGDDIKVDVKDEVDTELEAELEAELEGEVKGKGEKEEIKVEPESTPKTPMPPNQPVKSPSVAKTPAPMPTLPKVQTKDTINLEAPQTPPSRTPGIPVPQAAAPSQPAATRPKESVPFPSNSATNKPPPALAGSIFEPPPAQPTTDPAKPKPFWEVGLQTPKQKPLFTSGSSIFGKLPAPEPATDPSKPSAIWDSFPLSYKKDTLYPSTPATSQPPQAAPRVSPTTPATATASRTLPPASARPFPTEPAPGPPPTQAPTLGVKPPPASALALALKQPPPATPGTAKTPKTATKGVRFQDESDKKDAWPELKTLHQAVWNGKVAHEALHERDCDRTGMPPPRPLWPRPCPVQSGGGTYYDL